MNILLIDDDRDCFDILSKRLEKIEGPRFSLFQSQSLLNGLKTLRRGDISLVILDLGLPDSDGFATFYRFRSNMADIPLIIWTNLDDRALASKVRDLGVLDYAVKGQDNDERLIRQVQMAFEQFSRKEKKELFLQKNGSLISIGKLAAACAQKLADPLDAANRYLNLVLQSFDDQSTPEKEYVAKAKICVRRSIATVRQIMAYASSESSLKPNITEIHSLIQSGLITALKESSCNGFFVKNEFPDGRLFVRDQGLSYVFRHLFGEALASMSRASRKKMRVHTRRLDEKIAVEIYFSRPPLTPEEAQSEGRVGEEETEFGFLLSIEILKKNGREIRKAMSE